MLLIINAANGIVDSLYASNFIGKDALSAIGFYSPLNHFLFAVSIMMVSGSQLLIGEAMGRNQKDTVNSFFTTDLLLSLGTGLFTSVLLLLAASTDLTRFAVASAAERSPMNMYIIGQAVGIPALILGQQLFSFLSMENRRRLTMIASLACTLVNIIMNTMLVVFLKMGTLGLGLGSSAGLWAFFFTMAQYYFRGRSDIRFLPSSFNLSNSIMIMKRGYPGALSRFVEMFRCIFVNMLILRYVGSIGLSAFAAVNSVMAVFWPVVFGMVAVTRMLLSIAIGEEDRKSVADIMRIAIYRGGLLQCGISAFIILMAVPITMMFNRNPADPVFQMTVNGFRLMPLCMPPAIISLNWACYGQAIQNRFHSNVLPIIDGFFGVAGCSFLLIPILKMNGLYLSNILNGLLCCAVILGYAVYRSRRMPKTMEDMLLIPASFGAPDDARIDIELHALEDVLNVSQEVEAFCKSRNIPHRKSYFASLSLEEMAGNIIKHGFTADKKKHAMDIRIVHKDDDIVMRFLDDCKTFNPLERMRTIDEITPYENIGIRLVQGVASEVLYQNLLGLNVLTIRV